MNREKIVQIFFFAFLAIIGYELYEVLYPFLTPIAWAMLLAFLVHPAQAELSRILKSRSTAALVLTILVALGVILPAIWLSERLVIEAHTLYSEISTVLTTGGLPKAGEWIRRTRLGSALYSILARHGIKLDDEIRNLVGQIAKLTSNYVILHGSSLATNVASTVFHFGVALITFFYLLRDGQFYCEALRELTPLHEDDKAAIFDALRVTLSSVMRGLLLTAALDGITIGLGYVALAVPYSAFLGILTAACGLLPIGGTAIVWVPVTVYLWLERGWGPAAVMVAWASIALIIIDNFIKPVTMKHGTGLPTLALFFGLAGGLEAYGPLGIFAGPAVIAIFAVLLRVYRKTYVGQPSAPVVAPPPEPTQSQQTPIERKRRRRRVGRSDE